MDKKTYSNKSNINRNRSIGPNNVSDRNDNQVQRFGFGSNLFADMDREFQGIMEDFGMPRLFGRGSDSMLGNFGGNFGSMMRGFNMQNIDQEFDKFEEYFFNQVLEIAIEMVPMLKELIILNPTCLPQN